jgi:Flp pilus assembly protein TadG
VERRGRGRRVAEGEAGQVLPIVALALVALLGLTALSLDVGRMTITRRQLQNAVDAAAHAGVQVLPEEPGDATNAALDWATRNGLSGTDLLTVSITTTAVDNDTVRVTATRAVPYTFARVLNLVGANIAATATATVGSVTGGSQIMPFGLLDLAPTSPGFGYSYGTPYTIKDPPGSGGFNSPGNYGSLALDASGGRTMRDVIAAGGSHTPYRVGDQVSTLTGQQTGNLSAGFNAWAAQPR